MVVQNKELDAFSVCSSLQQLHAIIKHIGSNYNIHFEPFNHLDANLQQNLKLFIWGIVSISCRRLVPGSFCIIIWALYPQSAIHKMAAMI